MSGTTARKERTLRTGKAVAGDIELPPEPRLVRDPPPAGRNDDRGKNEPSVEEQQQASPSAGDAAPEQNRSSEQGSGAGPRPRALRTALKVLAWITVFPVLCVLPVILALRVSVNAYYGNLYDGWVALSIGVLAAMLLICVYIVVFMLSFRIRRRFFVSFLNVWLTAMLCYSGYALFHLSNANAKTEEVRSYYTSLHPLLRVAVKNLTLVDGQLVITDLHRTRSDYRRMGLRPLDSSMHFRQPTGFVHAVDIRTNGRSKAKNLLVELYFVLMGFETMRHVGTADHLHVSLSLRDADALTASSNGEASCQADC